MEVVGRGSVHACRHTTCKVRLRPCNGAPLTRQSSAQQCRQHSRKRRLHRLLDQHPVLLRGHCINTLRCLPLHHLRDLGWHNPTCAWWLACCCRLQCGTYRRWMCMQLR